MKAGRCAQAAAAALLILIAGCGDDDGTDGEATTTSEEAIPEPQVGECRGPIDLATINAPTDERPTVPCDQPHGSETAAVLDVPESLADASHDEAVAAMQAEDDDELGFGETSKACIEAANELWGAPLPTSDEVIRAGQFSSASFLPSAEEWEAGGRWVRCDAVIQPVSETDVRSSTHAFAGVAQLPVIPAEFLSCISLDTGGNVPCTEPHVGELMAVVFDFDVDLARYDAAASGGAGSMEMLFLELEQTYGPQCEAAVASIIGAQRDDIRVEVDFPTDKQRAEASIANFGAIRVGCYAITGQPRAGTLAGLGTGPL
jgi:hypothetical protein